MSTYGPFYSRHPEITVRMSCFVDDFNFNGCFLFMKCHLIKLQQRKCAPSHSRWELMECQFYGTHINTFANLFIAISKQRHYNLFVYSIIQLSVRTSKNTSIIYSLRWTSHLVQYVDCAAHFARNRRHFTSAKCIWLTSIGNRSELFRMSYRVPRNAAHQSGIDCRKLNFEITGFSKAFWKSSSMT